jgi:hypothetical protein
MVNRAAEHVTPPASRRGSARSYAERQHVRDFAQRHPNGSLVSDPRSSAGAQWAGTRLPRPRSVASSARRNALVSWSPMVSRPGDHVSRCDHVGVRRDDTVQGPHDRATNQIGRSAATFLPRRPHACACRRSFRSLMPANDSRNEGIRQGRNETCRASSRGTFAARYGDRCFEISRDKGAGHVLRAANKSCRRVARP